MAGPRASRLIGAKAGARVPSVLRLFGVPPLFRGTRLSDRVQQPSQTASPLPTSRPVPSPPFRRTSGTTAGPSDSRASNRANVPAKTPIGAIRHEAVGWHARCSC